jgi:hypothetical protein
MYYSTTVSVEALHMITGKLLGDGCITKQNERKPRFQFIHSTSDKDWCFYCFEQLKNDIPFTPPYYKKVKDNRILKGYTECFQVQSRTDPFITWLESIWYHNRIKKIPFEFLEQYLNEQALAWWYQDDGHLSKKGDIPKKIILSTDIFSTIENRRLIGLLARKFHLYFKLDSQNRLVLYDQLQIYYFLRIVTPYMQPSMKRKLIPLKPSKIETKRTTLYLPNNIHLAKPTTEINSQLFNLKALKEIVSDRTSYIEFYKNVIVHIRLLKETKSYQIVIYEPYSQILQSIKNQTGLTISQIITICLQDRCWESYIDLINKDPR